MRIFFAIDFPENIKEILLERITKLKRSFPAFKWIRKPALHLTLKFIGEIPFDTVDQIADMLTEPLGSIDSFSLSTTQFGFFPNSKRARVFYLDLEKSETLNRCFNTIEQNLESLGIEKENRRFHPHITLARIKNTNLSDDEITILSNQKIQKLTTDVHEIILMQSELSPSGARYTPVQRFSLRQV